MVWKRMDTTEIDKPYRIKKEEFSVSEVFDLLQNIDENLAISLLLSYFQN